jgi:hypothetical protein
MMMRSGSSVPKLGWVMAMVANPSVGAAPGARAYAVPVFP